MFFGDRLKSDETAISAPKEKLTTTTRAIDRINVLSDQMGIYLIDLIDLIDS